MCQPQIPYDPTVAPTTYNAVFHVMQGTSNPSTTQEATVTCPLPQGTNASGHVVHTDAVLYYKDFSTTNEFWCQVYDGFTDGTAYVSDMRWACQGAGGANGGCGYPTSADTGAGYLYWNSSALTWRTVDQWTNGNYGFICGIPKSNGSLSWIDTYYASY